MTLTTNPFTTKDACLTIRLPKELDHPVTDELRRESDFLMQQTYIRRIVFDFADTEFMDSSGIGLIMGRYKALGMIRGCISAVHVNDHIRRLLRLSGVHRYLKIEEEEG